MTASGPGKTSRVCPSSKRTTYGGPPWLPRTSMISPVLSGSPTTWPCTTRRSPTVAFMPDPLLPPHHYPDWFGLPGWGRGEPLTNRRVGEPRPNRYADREHAEICRRGLRTRGAPAGTPDPTNWHNPEQTSYHRLSRPPSPRCQRGHPGYREVERCVFPGKRPGWK